MMVEMGVKTDWFGGRGGRSIISFSGGSRPNDIAGGISAMILAYKICIVMNGRSTLMAAHLFMIWVSFLGRNYSNGLRCA